MSGNPQWLTPVWHTSIPGPLSPSNERTMVCPADVADENKYTDPSTASAIGISPSRRILKAISFSETKFQREPEIARAAGVKDWTEAGALTAAPSALFAMLE